MTDLQHGAACLRPGDELACLACGQRNRFFNEHMAAGAKRGVREVEMGDRRRGDNDGVNLIQQRAETFYRCGLVLVGQGCGARHVDVEDAGQFRGFEVGNLVAVIPAKNAGSGDADPYTLRHKNRSASCARYTGGVSPPETDRTPP